MPKGRKPAKGRKNLGGTVHTRTVPPRPLYERSEEVATYSALAEPKW